MKVLVYILLFLFVKISFSQNEIPDTTWFDSDWKEISKKYANFYRVAKKTNNGYVIADNYLNGTPQMIAEASQLSPVIKNGSCIYYYKNNVKSSRGSYLNNTKVGTWISYFNCGNDSSVYKMLEDGKKEYIYKSPLDKEDIYTVVEVMPEYLGGPSEMIKFIQKNIKYPKKARKKGWEGKAFVKFIVDPSGKVIEPVIIKSSGYSILDDEAINVVNLMPNWKPGSQDNKNVSVFFNLPLNFALRN